MQIIYSFNGHIWINRALQSIRFFRPLKIELIKETAVQIMMEKISPKRINGH